MPDLASVAPLERKPNTGSKVTILVLFIAAVGLAALATAIQFENRAEQERLVRYPGWKLDGETYRLSDAQIDPTLLVDWERSELAMAIAPHLNAYRRVQLSGQGVEDVEQYKQSPSTMVRDVARELRLDDYFERFGPSPDDRRNRDWTEYSYWFEMKRMSRRNIVSLVLALEDRYSFMKVRGLEMVRKDDSPGRASDSWDVKFTLVWYEPYES